MTTENNHLIQVLRQEISVSKNHPEYVQGLTFALGLLLGDEGRPSPVPRDPMEIRDDTY